MRITFLVPHLKVSGGVRVILTYADLLASRGHNVSVVVQNENPFRRIVANLIQHKPPWFSHMRARIVRVPDLREKHIPKADTIIVSAWRDAVHCMTYSDRVGKKFYLVQHDERLYHGEPETVEKTFRSSLRKIVVSTWLKETFRKEFGQEAFLLLNTVDRKLFYPVPVEPDPNTIRVLLLDHTYEWKGTTEGVEIVRDIKIRHPGIRLVLFGARRSNPPFSYDEYYFNPSQTKLKEIYSGAHIFLSPSWDEGFGLPALEAMACRCALVTYDNGGSRDYALNGRTALVAERKNKLELKAKLEQLIKDHNLRDKIAEGGYQFTQLLPTWEQQSKKLELFLEGAIND